MEDEENFENKGRSSSYERASIIYTCFTVPNTSLDFLKKHIFRLSRGKLLITTFGLEVDNNDTFSNSLTTIPILNGRSIVLVAWPSQTKVERVGLKVDGVLSTVQSANKINLPDGAISMKDSMVDLTTRIQDLKEVALFVTPDSHED